MKNDKSLRHCNSVRDPKIICQLWHIDHDEPLITLHRQKIVGTSHVNRVLAPFKVCEGLGGEEGERPNWCSRYGAWVKHCDSR